MSDNMRPGGAGDAEVLETGGGTAPPAAPSQKGIFDHLAEYLLQKPVAAEDVSSPITSPEKPTPLLEAPAPVGEAATLQEDGAEFEPPNFSSPGAAEQSAGEEEAVVREEAVVIPPGETDVETGYGEKRTAVDAERLQPRDEERIVEPVPVAQALPSAPSARPVPAPTGHAAGKSSGSKTWWAWFALIVVAAMLIAFAVGQFLGSAS